MSFSEDTINLSYVLQLMNEAPGASSAEEYDITPGSQTTEVDQLILLFATFLFWKLKINF